MCMSNVSEQWEEDARWLKDRLAAAAVKNNDTIEFKFCMGVRDNLRGYMSLNNARHLALRLVMK